jgi:HD-like signal output (HDOD) protein
MENINQQQKSDAGLINQREEHELGYCHAELGGSLLKYWQLPDNLWEPIYHHHNPLWGHEYAHMSSVLKVSDLMADSYCAESNTVPDILIEIAEPLKFLGLEINDIDLIWETVREDLSDLKLQFRVH